MTIFTENFSGSLGDDLVTKGWSNFTGGGGAGDNESVELTGANSCKQTSVSAINYYIDPGAVGVDGSGRQYVRAKLLNLADQGAVRGLALLMDYINARGFFLNIFGGTLQVRKITDRAIVVLAGVATVNVGDTIGFSVSGSTPNFIFNIYINGVLDAGPSAATADGTLTTWAGLHMYDSHSLDPWLSNYESGSGAFPVGVLPPEILAQSFPRQLATILAM